MFDKSATTCPDTLMYMGQRHGFHSKRLMKFSAAHRGISQNSISKTAQKQGEPRGRYGKYSNSQFISSVPILINRCREPIQAIPRNRHASYKAHPNKVCPTNVGMNNTLLAGGDVLERGGQGANQAKDETRLITRSDGEGVRNWLGLLPSEQF